MQACRALRTSFFSDLIISFKSNGSSCLPPLARQTVPPASQHRRPAPPSTGVRHHADGAAFLDTLVNYERQGVPDAAGTASSSKFDLGRMHRLLAGLGDPHAALPVVHVAGSKGKGSVVAMVSSVLRAAGYKVGTYTSPHLHHLGERISTDAASGGLSPQRLTQLVQQHRSALERCKEAEGGALSHFEVVTALALRHFADEVVDVAVVETGLGGATDATNVFGADQLQAAVVTSIGLEHVAALGGSLQSIAAAKAGIVRAGRPVVLGPDVPAAAHEVLVRHAAEGGCPLVAAATDLCSVSHVRFRMLTADDPEGLLRGHVLRERVRIAPGRRPRLPPNLAPSSLAAPPRQRQSGGAEGLPGADDVIAEACEADVQMLGQHQHSNIATAAAAVAVLRAQGWYVPPAALTEGLQAAFLPGRFQVLRLPKTTTTTTTTSSSSSSPPSGAAYVVLDGAHTGESAAALAATLRAVFPSQPLAYVVAMAVDKEHEQVMAGLRAAAPKVAIFTSVDIAGGSTRSVAPGTLAAHWQSVGLRRPQATAAAAGNAAAAEPVVRCRELIQAGLSVALQRARQELAVHAGEGVVCVTGSLHAVAEASRLLGDTKG